jgi:Tfp pilus assembly protein PilN
MSRLHLNLVDRRFSTLLWNAPAKLWIFAGLGTLFLCVAIVECLDLNQQLEVSKLARQDLVKKIDRNSKRDSASDVVVKMAPEQANAINAAIKQLNLPWSELLEAMEAASTREVAVLEWSPQAELGALKGMAEARTSEDMIVFVRKLKAQNFFTTVELTGHQINEQDRNKPLRFDFLVTWINP